jgi:tetratricopeptide (TPR) repeat protein
LAAGLAHAAPTDYDVELARLNQEIADAQNNAASAERPLRLAQLYYAKATLTGANEDLRSAAEAIAAGSTSQAPSRELYLLRVRFHLTLHRLDEARNDLDQLTAVADDTEIRVARADIDLQEGRYAAAQQGYEYGVARQRSWDKLARLAHLRFKRGDPAAAERLYQAAQDEITAKDMRAYAWVELQRGLLDLHQGRHADALAHYQRADQAYSGYWLVAEHLAELLGTERKFDAAIAVYERLSTRVTRPEIHQAFGDLCLYMGKPAEAQRWHGLARTAYLDSVARSEVRYLHHLATFYADSQQDGREAVKWARADLALRQNAATRDTLAWALFRDGQFPDALAETTAALAYGVRDAHMLFHAAMIHIAAGHNDAGKAFLREAGALNPYYDRFHVHR